MVAFKITEQMKYLRINLTKDVEDLYEENSKTLKQEKKKEKKK